MSCNVKITGVKCSGLQECMTENQGVTGKKNILQIMNLRSQGLELKM